MAGNQLTPVAALRFAVDFAQADLSQADLVEVGQQISDFNTGSPGLVGGRTYTRVTLVALQQELHSVLRRIVRGGHVSPVPLAIQFTVIRPMRFLQTLHGAAGRSVPVPDGVLLGVSSAELRDWFLYKVLRLLEDLGVEKLHECKLTECDRIFFKVTKKEYCSTLHQSRDYMRGYIPRSTRKGNRHGKKQATR